MTDSKISKKVLNDVAELTYQNSQKLPLFRKYPPNRNGMKSMLGATIEKAITCGIFDYSYKREKIEAFLILRKAEIAPGFPLLFGTINCTGTKRSHNWLKGKLREYQLLFNSKTHLELPVYLESLLPFLEELGFSIESIKLMGNPQDCLKKFSKDIGPISNFEDHGLFLVPATKRGFEAIRKIEREEFKANPQYGWFVSDEEWLKHSFLERVNSLKDKKCSNYIIKDKHNRIKGFFGANVRSTPNFGYLAGPEFVFDHSIQGKGLSKIAYLTLLEDMVKARADFFMGNTSRIGVLKNAKRMNRSPVNFCLRFSEGYFNS